MKYYLSAIKKYATFSGRSGRKEYWYFVLTNSLVSFGVAIVAGLAKQPVLPTLYAMFALLPAISVAVRRIHDVNKSGWYLMVPLYSLYLVCKAGDEGTNTYGDDPKGPRTVVPPQFQLPKKAA